MASSKATTVAAYLAELPAGTRAAISKVREVVNANLPAGFVESMAFGMIGWGVPLATYPDTYNGQPLAMAALAAQKNHNALYLMTVYGNRELEKWFTAAYKKSGKKLDMGKSCVRFKSVDDLALDVIGETIAKVSVDQLIAAYESVKGPPKKPAAKKPAAKPAAKKKPAKRT